MTEYAKNNNMKEDYLKMRNSGKYSINWFYKYFLENGGKQMDIQEFNMAFSMVDLNQILENLDKKFELTSLLDKNNKLIKVWK